MRSRFVLIAAACTLVFALTATVAQAEVATRDDASRKLGVTTCTATLANYTSVFFSTWVLDQRDLHIIPPWTSGPVETSTSADWDTSCFIHRTWYSQNPDKQGTVSTDITSPATGANMYDCAGQGFTCTVYLGSEDSTLAATVTATDGAMTLTAVTNGGRTVTDGPATALGLSLMPGPPAPGYDCVLSVTDNFGGPVLNAVSTIDTITSSASNSAAGPWESVGSDTCSLQVQLSGGAEYCPPGANGGSACSQVNPSVLSNVALSPEGPSISCTPLDTYSTCSMTSTTPEPGVIWVNMWISLAPNVSCLCIARLIQSARHSSTGTGARPGSESDDTLRGGRRADLIDAKGGDDHVRAGAGSDTVYAGEGRDTVLGEGGSDVLAGDGGNDRLYGGAGDDRMAGGDGNDLLLGGAGGDFLIAGAGDDVIVARDGDRDVVHCGPGHDIVYADASDRLLGCEIVRLGAPAGRVAASEGRVAVRATDLPGTGWRTALDAVGTPSAVRFGPRLERCETALDRSPAATRAVSFWRRGAGLSHVQVTIGRFRDAARAARVVDAATVRCLERGLGADATQLELAPGVTGYRFVRGSGARRTTIDLAVAHRGTASLVALLTTSGTEPDGQATARVLTRALRQVR